MKTLTFKNGHQVPVLGFGTWQLEAESCLEAVQKAGEVGFRHFDCAEAYGNQKFVYKGLKKAKLKREEFFLTSKVFHNHLQPDEVIKACNKTLKELKTDYLDLYLVHWPNKNVPMFNTFMALKQLQSEGKIKSIGVSNFTIHHLQDALETGVEIVNNQVEFHPSLNQNELKEFCDKEKIILTAYSPIAQGHDLKLPVIKKIAEKYQRSPSQVILNWIIGKGIIAIPRAADADHIEDNFKALEWELSEEDSAAIDAIGGSHRIVNPDFNEFDY